MENSGATTTSTTRMAEPLETSVPGATTPEPAPAEKRSRRSAKPTGASKPADVKKAPGLISATGRNPAKRKTASKGVRKTAASPRAVTTAIKSKETIVIDSSKTTGEEFAANIQDNAKAALDKGYAVAGAVSTLSRGNIEACLEAGKILANGVKEIGSTYAADSQGAFATLTQDIKALSAVRSPVDLFKVQNAIVRRNLETLFSIGAKGHDALVALAKDASAPVSKQAGVAVETLRKVA